MSAWDEAGLGAYLPPETVLGQIEAAVVVTDRQSNLRYANAYAGRMAVRYVKNSSNPSAAPSATLLMGPAGLRRYPS